MRKISTTAFPLMSRLTLISLLACCCVAVTALINKCPPNEDTSCTCRLLHAGPDLYCYKLNSLSNLQKTLTALKGTTVKHLTLSGVNASSIPTDLYQGLYVKELVLDNFEVDDASFRPGQTHFSGLEDSLVELEIRNSFKKNRPLLNLKLDHLKHMKILILEDNHIPEFGNDWFTNGPTGVATVIFERNGIEELGDRAFSSLRNLRLLAVAGNHLRKISRSMFPSPAKYLQKLDLAYNKIRKLPKDMFSGMPSLVDVNIGDNLIHILPEDTWSSILGTLSNLYIDGNPLQCDKSLKWICDYNIDGMTGKCSSPTENKGLQPSKICDA